MEIRQNSLQSQSYSQLASPILRKTTFFVTNIEKMASKVCTRDVYNFFQLFFGAENILEISMMPITGSRKISRNSRKQSAFVVVNEAMEECEMNALLSFHVPQMIRISVEQEFAIKRYVGRRFTSHF